MRTALAVLMFFFALLFGVGFAVSLDEHDWSAAAPTGVAAAIAVSLLYGLGRRSEQKTKRKPQA